MSFEEDYVYQSVIFKKRISIGDAIRIIEDAKERMYPLIPETYENRKEFQMRCVMRSVCSEAIELLEKAREEDLNANPIGLLALQELEHLRHMDAEILKREERGETDLYSASMFHAYQKLYQLFPESFEGDED